MSASLIENSKIEALAYVGLARSKLLKLHHLVYEHPHTGELHLINPDLHYALESLQRVHRWLAEELDQPGEIQESLPF